MIECKCDFDFKVKIFFKEGFWIKLKILVGCIFFYILVNKDFSNIMMNFRRFIVV